MLLCLAVPALSKSKKSRPKKMNLRATYKKALNYEKNKKIKTSAKILKKIIKKYPAFQPAKISLARIYSKRGLFSKAWRLWKKIRINNVPKKDVFYYGLGFVSLEPRGFKRQESFFF